MTAKTPLGVQLYTVRDLCKTDFAGTVKKLAQVGYKGVELAGYGSLKTAQEVRKALDDAGLVVAGNHIGIDAMEKELNKTLDEQEVLGNKMVILPYLVESRRKSAADYAAVARLLTSVAQACQKRGMTCAYHNHAFEFDKLDGGKTGFDILWNDTDPKLVKSELDVYWVKRGGQDPVGYIQKLSNRVVMLHLKDMAAGPEQKFAPVGTGVLDLKAIVAAGEKLNVEWNIVEQDDCYGMDPLDAVKTSFENLKKLGAV